MISRDIANVLGHGPDGPVSIVGRLNAHPSTWRAELNGLPFSGACAFYSGNRVLIGWAKWQDGRIVDYVTRCTVAENE